ncbi:MAG TPA: energy transducer TonB [Rhodanobacteraceae bacterium]
MKTASIVVLMVLAAASSCAMAQTVVRDYHTSVQLKVDTRGQVAQVGTPSGLPAMLVPTVRDTVAHWRFKAPTEHGVAVTATTWAYVDVQVVQRKNKQYGVRVVYENNGPKWSYKRAPRYPARGRQMHQMANLLFQATVEPDGSLADVHVVHSLGKDIVAFKRASMAALRTWRALPMRLNGKPVATHIRFAIHFDLADCSGVGIGQPCRWLSAAKPTAKHASKPVASRSKPAWARTPSSQLVASDSPLQRLSGEAHQRTGS